MLAVILAAGRGTRLRPLTNDRSKAMMPIAGRPMIGRVLAMLARGGAKRFVVVVHPDDRALIDHLRRPPWGERARLAYQKQRLGMANALACASPLIREMNAPAFLLASCDNVYPEGHVAALLDRQREGTLDATMTLTWVPREKAPATAVVVMRDGRVRHIIEKPHPEEIPSYGKRDQALGAPPLYALSTRVLDYLPQVPTSPRGEREFPDALRLLIEDGGVVGGQLVEERITLTHPEDLLALNRHFLRRDPIRATVEAELPQDVRIVPPVRVEAGVRLGVGCHVGPEVYLESGCRVGAGAVVRRAVILRSASVEAGAVVEGTVVR